MSTENVVFGHAPGYAPQERVCRYSHGPLKFLPDTFAVNQVKRLPPSADGTVSDGLIQQARIFTFGMGVCETCGYIELFDKLT